MKTLFFLCLLFVVCSSALAAQDTLRLSRVDDLYVVWEQSDGNDTEIFISQRNGGRWSEPQQLTDNDLNDSSPCVALDKNDRPWVVWVGADGVSTSIFASHKKDRSWSRVEQVDSVDIYDDTMPCVTVDGENKPWVVWSGNDGRDDDIYLSGWNGINWQPEVMVNEDDWTPDLAPAVALDSDKELLITWMGYNGRNYQLYYSRYSDGKTYPEKSFGLPAADSFGECPSMLSSNIDKIEVFWAARNNYYSVVGSDNKWDYQGVTSVSCRDEFLEGLLFELQKPLWIAWPGRGQKQNFRLMPIFSNQYLVKTEKNGFGFWRELFSVLDPVAEAAVEPTLYIAFGDSITNGRDLAGYPPKLELKLREGIGPSKVYNRGISGERTPEGLARIDGVLEELEAEYILIMEGTNDVTFGYSKESVVFNLGEMVDRSRAHDTIPFLGSLTPRQDSLDQRTREYYNPAIEEMAAEKDVPYVDMYSALTDLRDTHFEDGKHPNEEGYWVVAVQWYNAIYAYLNPEEEDSDDGGCGSVVLPVRPGQSSGPGLNLGLLSFLFVFILYLRKRFSVAS